ncbi:glutamate 5-kinase [Leptonema illini]|uniref:Glutamate 5-kinase n=1 Tax=Leptonema illini DSM 21528 TaxID=929563 RepID=H2CBX8_9LEPT|nr:glutamate 5-kinase [Leptonema illini]EHQ08650.1 glutamate 5-kinase [Leptonema illini DSM 21528]
MDRKELQKALTESKRVVLKIGSGLIATANEANEPNGLDRSMIEKLRDEVLFLRERGIEVILVSSGAVAMGRSVLRKTLAGYHPQSNPGLSRKQALAAVGQARLISLYGEIFAEKGLAVSQILITARDFRDRNAYLNIGHTIQELLRLGVVPIINENDTVSTEELRFGDNDLLSAACAALLRSDLLVLLTSVNGFLINEQRVPVLTSITADVLEAAGGPSGPGSGGMRTKIRAGQLGLRTGFRVAILPGRDRAPVQSLFTGEDIGTIIGSTEPSHMNARKMWLLFARTRGAVIIDDGAVNALRHRGSSLLGAGIKELRGAFAQSDVVEIVDAAGQSIGRGIVRAGSREIQASIDAKKPLSYEVIHRNDLIIETEIG